jgi:plastocyanin
MMKAKSVCIALALISASACGGGGGSNGPPAGPIGNTPPPAAGGISVSNNTFSPAAVTVTPGTTVVWAWNSCTGGDGYGGGETCVAHNVLFDDGFTSGLKDKGTFSRSFPTAGTYSYHCAVHQSQGMTGSVVVQ